MKLDGKTIQTAIMQLVEDYKFDPYQVIEIVNLWIRSAFRKDNAEYRKAAIEVNIDGEGEINVYREYEVTDSEIEDDVIQMSVADAKKHRKDVKSWEKLLINITPEDLQFSRIAVQAAAQTIKQHLKGIERERFYEKFQNKQGELLKARVIKVHGESVVLDIEWTPVVLPSDGQIPHRMYELGEEIFVYLKQISKWQWWVILDITQSSEDYIEAILKRIVPEIEEGIISIKRVVRIAGKRTKVLVSSNDVNVDPIGILVGQKWDRINIVLSLLDGEKLDYIEETENKEELIAACLKPADVQKIEMISDTKAKVTVPATQKALAIGKNASNIKLAGQITGLMIEIV